MPENILIINNKSNILKVSFKEVFFLKRTRIPSPALEHKPDITEPKPIAPFK